MRCWMILQTNCVNWTTDPFCNRSDLTKSFRWVASIPCCKYEPSDSNKRNLSLLLFWWFDVFTALISTTWSTGFTSVLVASPLDNIAIAPSVRLIDICRNRLKVLVSRERNGLNVESFGGVWKPRERERKIKFSNNKGVFYTEIERFTDLEPILGNSERQNLGRNVERFWGFWKP